MSSFSCLVGHIHVLLFSVFPSLSIACSAKSCTVRQLVNYSYSIIYVFTYSKMLLCATTLLLSKPDSTTPFLSLLCPSVRYSCSVFALPSRPICFFSSSAVFLHFTFQLPTLALTLLSFLSFGQHFTSLLSSISLFYFYILHLQCHLAPFPCLLHLSSLCVSSTIYFLQFPVFYYSA